MELSRRDAIKAGAAITAAATAPASAASLRPATRRTTADKPEASVRERLLLVTPAGEIHEYRCKVCSESLGTRDVTARRPLHNSFTSLRCTPIASANAPRVKFKGATTSISPTLTGSLSVLRIIKLTRNRF